MIFKGKKITDNERILKNTLYHSLESTRFKFIENAEGIENIVYCNIILDKNEEAVFAHEYRIQDAETKYLGKMSDLILVLANSDLSKYKAYVYEVKKSISGPDKVIKAIEQIKGGIRQVYNLVSANGCGNFEHSFQIGIVTGSINFISINEEIKRLLNEIEEFDVKSNALFYTVYKKKQTILVSKREKLKVLQSFIENTIQYMGKSYYLNNILMNEISEGYECDINFRL